MEELRKTKNELSAVKKELSLAGSTVTRETSDVAKQIAVIFAGTNGYLDDIPVSSVAKFESELYEALESRYAEVLKRIKDEKVISENLEAQIKETLEDFKRTFEA